MLRIKVMLIRNKEKLRKRDPSLCVFVCVCAQKAGTSLHLLLPSRGQRSTPHTQDLPVGAKSRTQGRPDYRLLKDASVCSLPSFPLQ